VFRRTVSLLVLLGSVGVLNAQVQPKPTPPKPSPPPKEQTLDEKIAIAMKSHPDIKAAEAKRALAEAELEQAKLALSQKIAVANAKVTTAQEELVVAKELVAAYSRLSQAGTLSKTEELLSKKNLTIATSNLTLAETELKNLLTMPKEELRSELTFTSPSWTYVRQAKILEGAKVEPVTPETPTKLGDTLSIQVDLDLKNPNVSAMNEWISKMVEGKVVLRFQGIEQIEKLEKLKKLPQLGVLKGKMTLAACFQLYIDELNAVVTDENAVQQPYQVYVRDYGILICPVRSAPKGAMTLTEFLKQEKGKQQ
jgi:hypothetical protein